MKIKISPNSDTPFCLVSVILESLEEELLSIKELWEQIEDYAWNKHRCNPGNLFEEIDIRGYDGARLVFVNGEMIPANYEWLPEDQKRKI